jgi:lipopolysaccharide transport system permease protein
VIITGQSNIYLAYLAIGITLWQLIMQSIVPSCTIFIVNKASILDGISTYADLILKGIATNLILLLHNIVVVAISFLVVGVVPPAAGLLSFVTLPLVVLNLIWMCVIAAVIGTRYHDFGEMIRSTVRLLFFMTPILWIPHAHMRGRLVDALLYLNPFYYMVTAVRDPLLYGRIPYFEIAVLAAAVPAGWVAASFLYARTRPWLALWI